MFTTLRTLILSFALPLFAAPTVFAQDDVKERGNFDKVSFNTSDGVRLYGYFYPGPKGPKSPAVVLVHDLPDDSRLNSWRELAADLQGQEKAAVLVFSLRGHGESVKVKDEFWDYATNRYAAAGRVSSRSLPEQIAAEDFQKGYHRAMVNDLAAAKVFLDQRNDGNECNSRQTIFIAEGEAAALTGAWVGLESRRYRIANGFAGIRDKSPESGDILACIWLNPRPTLGGKSIELLDWLANANTRKAIRVGILYDAKDTTVSRFTTDCERLYARKRDTKAMFVALKATQYETRGGNLIDSETIREKIVNYVGNRLGDDLPGWEEKELDENRYVWLLSSGTRVAKLEGERTLRVVAPEWVDRP